MRALPLRLRHREGEPGHGAMARLATRHREPDTYRFATVLGCPMGEVLAGRGVAHVASLAGIDPDLLRRDSPVLDVPRRNVVLSGETVLLNDWSIRRRCWCPACFSEDRMEHGGAPASCWHRSAWDVASVRSCPKHRIPLARSCPECGAAQDWRGPAVDRCRCGADLCRARAERLAPGYGAASDYVSGRLGLGRPMAVPLVDGLTLKDAVVQLERLGECAVTRGHISRLRPDGSRDPDARDRGLAVASEWPGSFDRMLDGMVTASRAAGAASGMIGTYGWVYLNWASRKLPDGFAGEVRGVMAAHARRNSVVAQEEPLFGEPPLLTMNITAAARLMGKGFEAASKELAAWGFARRGVRRGVAAPLDEDAVKGLASKLAGELGVMEVAGRLGLAKSQARAILDLGLVAPVATAGAKRRFAAAAVDAFLARLSSGAVPRAASGDGLVPLPQACKAARITVASACAAILRREISVVAICDAQVGLRGLLVRAADVRRSGKGEVAYMSVESASSLLRLHPDATRHLLRTGVLHRRNDGKSPAIRAESVRQFGRRYVAGADIAATSGLSTRTTTALLASSGVVPAFGPPACRQVIFERAAVRTSSLRSASPSV